LLLDDSRRKLDDKTRALRKLLRSGFSREIFRKEPQIALGDSRRKLDDKTRAPGTL
jgi:hypothetical protein